MSKRKNYFSPNATKNKRCRGEDVDGEDAPEDRLNYSQQPDFISPSSIVKEAEVGIIEKVSLKNFMCHNRLDVALGPNINFIIGRNGSGKSAIVTALVVGLGGKAAVTSRGTTVKGFIKTGKHSAEVEIRLRNRGLDAYKPDEFGDTIIVQRKFSSDGSSQYKLRSRDGKIISQKREELAHILDQFNIQVDNPVAILNQDTSRNFLNSKSPHDKYKFFLKATQLEQMKHDYAVANEQKQITLDTISHKQQTFKTLEHEVYEWEQKFKALGAIGELKEKVKRLKNEMAWAFVHEKEKGLEPLQKEVRQIEVRMPKFVQKVEESKTKFDAIQNENKALQDRLKALIESVQQLQPQHDEKNKLLNEKKKAVRNAQLEVRKLENNLSSIGRDRDQTLERISEIKNSAQHDYESERRNRENQIQGREEKLTSLQAQRSTTDHQREQFRSALTKYKGDEYHYKQEEQALRTKVSASSKQLQNLQGARSNRLRRFGQWLPDVHNEIEKLCQRGLFHKRPRGPLGACFELKESRWALAVESCLKSLIQSFCCHDHNDEKLLEQIFETHCPPGNRPSIIVSKFLDKMHDVSRHRVRSNLYSSVLDIIKTDDIVIANCLIDQRGIENVTLIADNVEARQVMEKKPPQNCKEAFTLIGDQVYCQPTFRYYSNTNDKAHFLTASVEDDIVSLQEELKRDTQEQECLRQKRTQLTNDIRRNQTEEKKSETQLMKIGDAIKNLSFEINELKCIEDPAPVAVTTLEEEVETFEEQMTTLKEQKSMRAATYEELRRELLEEESESKETDQRMKEVVESSYKIKEEMGHKKNEIDTAKSHLRHYDQKLKEQERKVSEQKKLVEQYQKQLESDISKAERIHAERIKTRRTVNNISGEIEQIEKRIKAEERVRGSEEEITRQYSNTRNAYLKINTEVNQLNVFIKRLQDALKKRQEDCFTFRKSISFRIKVHFAQLLCNMHFTGNMKINHHKESIKIYRLETIMTRRQKQYYEFRQSIALRAKHFFIVLLSNRQYTGKMAFNHKKEMLDITVQPVKNTEEGAKDMRSLSGGEKSFSTMCFILALWDAMESPFRCLDEFDVFMDMVSRQMSMDMMMEVANTQTQRQFIFLTPQDISQLSSSKNLRIFRMPDPDRTHGSVPTEPASQSEVERTMD